MLDAGPTALGIEYASHPPSGENEAVGDTIEEVSTCPNGATFLSARDNVCNDDWTIAKRSPRR
jgi:hypothetical protein